MLKLQKDRLVVGKMRAFEPFDPDKFMEIWDYDEGSIESCRTRAELEDCLWEVCSWALTRGHKFATKKGKKYIKENIFTLDIWDDKRWAKLKSLATEKSEEIVAETFRIRDELILQTADGMKAAMIQSFGTIRHPLPAGMLDGLNTLSKDLATSSAIDDTVFVHLIRTLAIQATDTFKERITKCLGSNAAAANFPPGDWPEEEDGEAHIFAPKLVFFASVKGAQRMSVKVGEYRSEAEEGAGGDAGAAAVEEPDADEITVEEMGQQSGAALMESAGAKSKRKSLQAMGFVGLGFKRMLAKRHASRGSGWPYIQKLGDCLRCTVDCESSTEMLEAWEQIRAEFDCTTDMKKYPLGHGRLKNNLQTSELKPPDMLLNVVFDAGGYDMVAEVQIHLRAIHRLKQQNHFPYEISRAPGIDALLGGVSHEVAKLKHAMVIHEEEHERETRDLHNQVREPLKAY